MLSLIQRALAALRPKRKLEDIDVGFADQEAARQHAQARAAFIKSCRSGIPAETVSRLRRDVLGIGE